YTCTPCSVNCSSAVALCQHVIGNKHKRKLHIPQKQNNVNRLSYFLNTYVKEDPIVGLEYVMELEGSSYKYSCQLCSVVNVNLMKIVGHITGPDHTELYILNHCPDLMPLKHDLQKPSFTKALRDACARIIKLQGRKEIQVNFTTNGKGMTKKFRSCSLRVREKQRKPSRTRHYPNLRVTVKQGKPLRTCHHLNLRVTVKQGKPLRTCHHLNLRVMVKAAKPSKTRHHLNLRMMVKAAKPSKTRHHLNLRMMVKPAKPSKTRHHLNLRMMVKAAKPSKTRHHL
ncbi:unnamed protein product, partial [Staurois parvus]